MGDPALAQRYSIGDPRNVPTGAPEAAAPALGGSDPISTIGYNGQHIFQSPIPSSAYTRPNPLARGYDDLGRTPGQMYTYNNGAKVPFNPNVPNVQTYNPNPTWAPETWDALAIPAAAMTLGASLGGAGGAGDAGYTPGPEDGFSGGGFPAPSGYVPGPEDALSPGASVGGDTPVTDFFGSTEGTPGYTTAPGAWDPSGNAIVPGTAVTAAGAASAMPAGTQAALEKVFGKGIMSAIGNNPAVAAALAAGVLEKSNNPLTQPTIDAIKGAIASGQSIQGMQIPGITPSLQRAIDTANTNVGAWKPYTDEAAAFTRSGGAPITGADIQGYMNPYIEQALNPAARKVSEAAAAQRMSDAAKAGSRGAFGTERNDQIAGLNKRNELMSLGDVYGTGYAKAFDTALSTAGTDKSRALTAGGAFGNLATTTSALGGKDVEGLTSAGGIESLPFTEELTKQKTAGDVLSGAGSAGARAIGSTGQPSLLTNLTGAAGVLGAFDKLGNPSTPSVPSVPSIPGIGSPAATPSLPAPSANNPFDDSNAGVFGS